MELVSSYDIMFDNIVEQIKNKCDEIYEFEIVKEEINIVLNIKFLKLSNDNRQSNSFIIDINNKKLIGKNIKFSVNSLKIKIINNRPYFLIQDYEILNQEKNKIIFQKLSPHLKPNLYKVITSVEEIKENYLYTLILKAKEIKIESQQYKFQLEDSNKNSINVDGSEKFDLENGKIYCFHGYIYNTLSLKFEPTNISYLEEFSCSTLKIHNSEEILKSNINSLLNFKGKVKSFNITDNIIIIETEDKIEYKINANYHLIKQLVLNNECKFYYFFKKSNEEFFFSNLSFIEAKEETFINFNFPFYDIEEKYYNKIKINDKLYDLNNKNIKIKIEDKEKNNLFLQKVSYERIIEKKTLDSYIFYLELNKGQIYDLESSSEKNGFSYEFIIQSILEGNLPENIYAKIKEQIIKINPNKNGNKLIERFTIINFPKQDIKTILELPEDDIEDKNYFRYLLMIDDNNKKILKKFETLESADNQRKDFYIPLEIENALKKASAQCYINFNKNYEDKLYNIDKKDINIFVKLISELMDGFQTFKFKNTKRQYNIIKDITSFSLNYYAELFLGKYYSFRKNYEILLDSMINLEYIDRIKILLTFMVKIIRNSKKKKVYYDFIHLIDIDNEKSYEKFTFVKDAFDIFYKIIDNLTEDCPLFQAIHQFNSKIYCDKISNENMHSSSILNLNDIKLELVKNINRFLFLSEKPVEDCSEYADFEHLGLLVTIYMYSFCDDEFYNLDENNYKKATSVILFLLFHECLRHQKKNINNEKVKTPRKHRKNDFQEFPFEKVDTGSSLEIILMGKIVNMVYLMNSSKSEQLLDPNLYTGKNFIKLQEIYSSIETDNINMINDAHQSNNINISVNSNNTQSSSSKIKLRKKKRRLMYTDLLQLYNGISEEEKEKLKDDEDYQRFLLMYERRYQKPSEYMKIPDIFALRRAYKK